jgi:hypothetical protein
MIGALLSRIIGKHNIWEWGIPTSTFNQKISKTLPITKVQVIGFFKLVSST